MDKAGPHTDTIMIIDDLPDNLRLLQEVLQDSGHRIVLFTQGAAALRAAERHPPDLVLLDITMPEMDGFELCRRLKRNDELKDIPVLFISALMETADKVTAFSVGGVDYITKPFQPEEVLARVSTHLALRRERRRSEELLLAMLPRKVVDDLRATGRSEPRLFSRVTILFSDFAGFTETSSELNPKEIIDELNDLYSNFDSIMLENGCERIKTIGDSYLAACGLPDEHPDHALAMANAARGMLSFIEGRNSRGGTQWRLRIGMHSGPVVAGIVGTRKYIYDIFGDTVNIASRMESMSEVGRINVSRTTRELLAGRVPLDRRPMVEVKGKGMMEMYFFSEP
jgi:class 3 adenylate cyclase